MGQYKQALKAYMLIHTCNNIIYTHNDITVLFCRWQCDEFYDDKDTLPGGN